MSENNGISERLREARTKAGLTQEQACKQARIPKTQTLSTYERGTSTPRLDTLMELVKLYGVSADWVLFGKERANEDESQKSPAEYFAQLVEAVDYLGLEFGYMSKQFIYEESEIGINLNSSRYAEISFFSVAWERFRNLLDENLVTQAEYKTLRDSRLPPELNEKTPEPDPCEDAMENGELPF